MQEEKMEDGDRRNGSSKKKVCGVCGDKALGYNFNAITCESCKAFFRRNALVSKEFKCPFTEQCQITVVTRRFCQKCRLEKCFAIGMVKEYIMSDEDKAQKRRKIAENRAQKRLKLAHDRGTGKRPGPDSDDDSFDARSVKREEGDDCPWTPHNGKHPSPDGNESQNSVDSLVEETHFQMPAENKAVSVIRNNGSENGDALYKPNFYNESPNWNHRGVHSTALSDVTEYENGAVVSPSADRDQNVMIRSILTTSTPGEDPSKLMAALGGGAHPKQPMCDNSLNGDIEGLRHKSDVAKDVLQDIEQIQVEPKSMKLILCEAIKLEFETYTSLPQISSSSRELNDAERARLNELIVANKALLAPLDDYMTNLIMDETRAKAPEGSSNPVLLGIINLTAVAIRRLIKMAKKINAFKNMCEEDQVSLLKGGCTEMMILRSTMTYDCARDLWTVPHSQESFSKIKADVLKFAKGNIYQEHDRFVRSFDAKWRTDENIILIMSAIVLFTPTRPKVVHSDVIKLEQNSYYYLLRRYLESVYPGCEAKSAFLKLIQKIMELQKLAEEVIGVYLDVNPSEVEPLLIEIFDLKQPQ